MPSSLLCITGMLHFPKGIKKTLFRGIGLFHEEIALETETCNLCANNCCC